MSWEELFGTQNNLSWLQECARAVLIFGYGLLLVRLSGRRVFGRWSAIDIIISIIVGSSLSRALTGNAPLFGTLAATTLMMALHWVVAVGVARSRLLSRILEGGPIKLGEGGEADSTLMRRHAVSLADLHEAMRQKGVEQVKDTRLLLLEPSGNISVLK